MCIQGIHETLIKHGFEHLKTTVSGKKGVRIYRITKEKFDDLIDKLDPIATEDEEMVDMTENIDTGDETNA